MWIERTTYTTAYSFPGILKWFEVKQITTVSSACGLGLIPPIFCGVECLAAVRTTTPSTVGCGTPIISASVKSKCVSSLMYLSFYAIPQTALPQATKF